MMREMSRFSSWPNWLLLAGITSLASFLRLWQINESLWVDELHTSWCLHGGLGQVAKRAALGNQSPLYFYLVWGVTRLLGESEVTLRLPSLIAGIALPGVTWLLVRRMWRIDEKALTRADEGARDWSALLAAFLVAVDPTSIFYATEARPYACVELLAAVAAILALNVVSRPGIAARTALIAVHVALFYLHYTAVLYVAASLLTQLAFCFLWPSPTGYRWKSWLLDTGFTLLLYLPALNQIEEIASRRENWRSFVDDASLASLIAMFPWSIAPLGLALILVWRSIAKPSEASRVDSPLPPSALLLCGGCLIPILMAWLLTWLEIARLYHPRYLVAILPAMWGAVALASQVSANRSLRSLATVAISFLALWSGLIQNWREEGGLLSGRNEDWKAAVRALQEEVEMHPDWKVLVHSGLIETDALRSEHDEALRDYGLLPVNGIYEVRAAEENLVPLPMTDPGVLIQAVREQIIRSGGTIVILRLPPSKAVQVEEHLAQSFASSRFRTEVLHRQLFGKVQLLVVSVHPTESAASAESSRIECCSLGFVASATHHAVTICSGTNSRACGALLGPSRTLSMR